MTSEKTESAQQNSFQFKYVPENEFARIIKHVRRNKRKKQEEKEWLNFVASKNKICLCDTCPEGLKYLREKSINAQMVSEEQNEQQSSEVYIPQNKNFNNKSEDEILESEKGRRKMILEPKTPLRKDMQNISDKSLFLQNQVKKCIHVPELLVNKLVHNAEQTEEFVKPTTSQGCLLNDVHCTVHTESFERNESSRGDALMLETFPAEENVNILSSKSAAPDLNQCEIHKEEVNHSNEENGNISHVMCAVKLNHYGIQNEDTQCPNCSSEKNVKLLPVESASPKFKYCEMEKMEVHCQISPTEQNISPSEIVIRTLKLHGSQRNGDCSSNRQIENNIKSLSTEPDISKPTYESQKDEVNYPNEQNINRPISPIETVVPKLNLCGIHRDGAYSQRIITIRKKIDVAFDSLLKQLQNIPEPDGCQDLMRRRKRAAEFSARFARNYLYHLRHQVCEIRKQMKESSSTYRGKHTSRQALYQKLVSGHQTALQGLEAYLHHIPSSVRGAAISKIKELFQSLTELFMLCNKLGIPSLQSSADPGTDSIEKKSRAVLQLIDNVSHRDIDNDTIASQETAINVMTTTGQREWASSLREPEKNISTARGASVKPALWKNTATKLARAAYGSPYKKRLFATCKTHKRVGNSKTNSKAEQSQSIKSGSALKMPYESASGLDLRSLSTKLAEFCEEKIRSMLDSNAKTSEDKPEATVSQEKVEQLAAQHEEQKAVIQQIENISSNSLQYTKSDNTSCTEHKKETLKSRPTVTGSKNAQLICLPISVLAEEDKQNVQNYKETEHEKCSKEPVNNDGNSEQESKTLIERNLTDKSEPNLHHIHVSPSSFRTSENTLRGRQENYTNVHHKELLPTVLTLSKKVIRSAMNCRQNFQNYVKANPMYKDVARPWVTLERLSEKMIDELLQEMACEAKLDILVSDMYSLELQGEKNVI